jgi:hypothetical protein
MKKLLSLAMASVALTGSLYASEYTDLEAKLNALIEEVESLKASKTDKELSSYFGMGDAASRVYQSDEKVSVGGYGHTDYVNNQGKDTDTIDNYRAIMYFGYSFSDKIKFQSEIEFEHANEIKVEFAAVDFLVNDALNFRTGNFLIPVGHVNLRHEPTLFLNVSRPETERRIIPSTWHENGLMVYGKNGNFEYQFASTASLDGAKGDNIRSMRSGGSKSRANDLGYSARFTYKPVEGLQLIASGFTGEVDQGDTNLAGAAVTITEAHILYNKDNINFTALYAQTKTDSADKVAAVAGTDAASKTSGYYVTLGYEMGKWTPFVHVEEYNQFDGGFTSAGAATNNDETTKVTAFGVNFRPHKQVVIKADYMDQETAGAKEDKFSMGVGYLF